MANQPKRYKKFVATAATATLVASAIAPVASASFKDVADNNDHKKNIEAIAELGYMGAGDNFRPSENVTRGQVAIILANWAQDVAGLEVPADYKTVQRFKDVPLTADDKLLQSAALVKDYGIFEGSNGNLNGANPISREHMALVLNKAFEAVNGTSLVDLAGDTSDVTFADEAKINKNYLPVVKALKKLGITAPASFNPSGNVTRGQFATFFIQTNNQDVEAKVASVSAINATDLKVIVNAGKETLKASDFEVTVNGTEATVTATKVSDKEYKLQLTVPLVDGDKVVVKGVGEVTGTATTTYATPEITKVEGVVATVFADKEGQELAVKVNGAVQSVSDLAKQGYKVTFQATEDVFGGTTTSGTGILDKTDLDNLYQANTKTFKYKVSLQRNNEVFTSTNVSVTISQEDKTAASTIKSVKLSATTAGGAIEELTSGKLVKDVDTAQIDELIADLQDGRKNVNLIDLTDSNVKFESSDVTIASVDSTGLITAGSRTGKVTITATSGTQKKEINLEVVSKARELTTATYSGSAVKLTNNAEKELTFTARDQYGDIFNTATANIADITAIEPVSNGKVITDTDTPTPTAIATKNDEKGTFTATVKAHATEVGSGTLYLNIDSKRIASTSVSVAKETGLVKQTLVKSANKIDLNPNNKKEDEITFKLENLYNGYFKENAVLTPVTIEIYDATKTDTPIYELTAGAGETEFTIDRADLITEDTVGITTIAALESQDADDVTTAQVLENSEVGNVLVVVKDTATQVEIDKTTFSVVDTSANATSVVFNTSVEFTDGNATATLNLADLLTSVSTTASSHDGVLRYELDGTDGAYVYYNKDADVDGFSYADGDILVGKIEGIAVTTGDSITLAQGTPGKYLANTITVEHSITKEGDKAQFNLYKRGNVSVGKGIFVKVAE